MNCVQWHAWRGKRIFSNPGLLNVLYFFVCLQLIINLMDMNDNSPTFPLSQYVVQGIAETVAIGTDIIQGNERLGKCTLTIYR